MNDLYIWGTVAVIAAVTALLRFLPFVVFSGKRAVPPIINRLGRVLPSAVMGMLVVYCLKDVHFANVTGFLPPLIACLVVGVLHVWKRNALLSIITGTVCYMLLVQIVF